MVAIPLAMGLAMASGLPPEMGIVGGGSWPGWSALLGGSKYQVYGPTAAFIPVIAAITAKYEGYTFLIWCSLLAGVMLTILGLAQGRLVAHSSPTRSWLALRSASRSSLRASARAYAPQVAAAEASLRAGRPDLSKRCWTTAACAASSIGDFEQALAFVDRGQAVLRGVGLEVLEVQLLAARAHVLVRLGRLAEAEAATEEQRALAERLQITELIATSEHDRGMVALALGRPDRAEQLLAAALEHGAPVSRPGAAGPGRRAGLAGPLRRGRGEARATALEPLRDGDLPDTLVPRLTRLQGKIAAGRGEHALARRRLAEAADGWRRVLGPAAHGNRYISVIVDFGREGVDGLDEPARELDRVEAELAALDPAPV